MWFGVMFAILVELVPSNIRSKAVAVVLFCINNVGGNTPVIVDPIANRTSYRTAIIILYPGSLFISKSMTNNNSSNFFLKFKINIQNNKKLTLTKISVLFDKSAIIN